MNYFACFSLSKLIHIESDRLQRGEFSSCSYDRRTYHRKTQDLGKQKFSIATLIQHATTF